MDRYEGPLKVGMVLTAPDNDGKLGSRRIRLVGTHVDGDWLYDDLPARMWRKLGPSGETRRCAELNIRIVFRPEEECYRCGSPAPHLHPAVQFEGEVQPCPDRFHLQPTAQNTPERIADFVALQEAIAS